MLADGPAMMKKVSKHIGSLFKVLVRSAVVALE